MKNRGEGGYCPLCGNTLTYLLTPWRKVLLKKLTGLQLVEKYPAFYGTRRFITAFTSARHLSLSWASSIQFLPPHRTPRRSILILSSHLSLPPGVNPIAVEKYINQYQSSFGSTKWSLSLRFPHQNPVYVSPLPHTRYMSRLSHSSLFIVEISDAEK